MALKYQYAFFGIGAVLFFIGLSSFLYTASNSNPEPDIMEALSNGFSNSYYALFSGVLLGVGLALLADGFMVRYATHPLRASIASLLSVFSLAFLFLAVLYNAQAIVAITLFFTFFSAAGTLLASSAAFALSMIMREYTK
jgi:hypothetical protein